MKVFVQWRPLRPGSISMCLWWIIKGTYKYNCLFELKTGKCKVYTPTSIITAWYTQISEKFEESGLSDGWPRGLTVSLRRMSSGMSMIWEHERVNLGPHGDWLTADYASLLLTMSKNTNNWWSVAVAFATVAAERIQSCGDRPPACLEKVIPAFFINPYLFDNYYHPPGWEDRHDVGFARK